jgi:N-acetylglucosamine-6-phosphate deacetylase
MRRDGSRLIDDFDTLAGGVVTLFDAVRYVVETLGLPLAEALRMSTSTPARLLGLQDQIGVLAPGARADLVHLADDLTLRCVWLAGAAQAA